VADQADITEMLDRITAGDGSAMEQLLPAVYDELHALAERHLRKERPDHTLQATALVNEAYLRLVRQSDARWLDRVHFLCAAGQAIRRILVDHARTRNCHKRAGRKVRIPLENLVITLNPDAEYLIALDEALQRLSAESPRKAQVVELRFFSGLTADESAAVLGITTRSVERDWRYARAWLYRELGSDSQANKGAA